MKRRYKLMLIIVFAIILILVIYFLFFKQKNIYVAIGESNKLSTYTYEDLILNNKKYEYLNIRKNGELLSRTINRLKNNENNINYYIKNAELITIFLDNNELNNYKNITSNIAENYLNEVELLFQYIYRLNKNIYFIDVINIPQISNYIKILAHNYDIYYYCPKQVTTYKNLIYLSKKENLQIFSIIKKGIVN